MAIENWFSDPEAEIKRLAIEAAKEEARRQTAGVRSAISGASRGISALWADKEVVPFEPEVLGPYQRDGLKSEMRRDAKGMDVKYYVYRGAPNGVISYVFERTLYEAQIQLFTNQLTAPKAKAADYRSRAELIRETYRQKKDEADEKAGDSVFATESRNAEIESGVIEAGDTRDGILVGTEAAAQGASVGVMPDGEKLRALMLKYEVSADKIEADEINPINERIKRTQGALDRVNEAYDEYLELLND